MYVYVSASYVLCSTLRKKSHAAEILCDPHWWWMASPFIMNGFTIYHEWHGNFWMSLKHFENISVWSYTTALITATLNTKLHNVSTLTRCVSQNLSSVYIYIIVYIYTYICVCVCAVGGVMSLMLSYDTLVWPNGDKWSPNYSLQGTFQWFITRS